MDDGTKFGSRGQVGFAKNSGKNQFKFDGNFVTKNWDINDLGFSTSTNFANYNSYYGYRILEPTKKFNNIFLNFNVSYYHRLQPFLFTNLVINHNNQFTNKNFRSFGGGFEITPFGENDIYEPRTEGRFLKTPSYLNTWIWTESDSRKKFQYNVNFDYYAYNEKGRNLVNLSFYLRSRFSDKFKTVWQFNPAFSNNEIGFAGKEDNEIYMARRQRNTYENSLTSQYTFNDKMSLSLAFRHYYSDVTYKSFFTLNEDGTFVNKRVKVRYRNDIIEVDREMVTGMDVSPKQLVSIGAAMIPFLEHDDAKRALMGANMQRQAVPLIMPEAPIVGTGMEYRAAKDSGILILAEDDKAGK